ncbi:MAG: phage holin family protein [Candidatus Obscuribacterales bacterium]|nr:phage holin family protein [Steroidobacteraceae bacterium]
MSNSDNPNAGSDDAGSSASVVGQASGLFRSLTQLIATLVTLAQTRLELLTVELQEEVQRAAALALYGFVALLAAMLGLFFGAFTIVFIYWDTHRILAAGLVTLTFFALAAIAVFALLAKIRAQPRFLDATLSELKKDTESLRDRTHE